MKVSLVFLLVAVYGCVAQDAEVPVDPQPEQQVPPQTPQDKGAIGKYLDSVKDWADKGINAQKHMVNQGANVVDSTVNGSLDFAKNATEQSVGLAKEAVGAVANIAGGLADLQKQVADNVLGWLFPSGKIHQSVSDIINKSNQVAHQIISSGQNAANSGLDMTGQLTGKVTSGVSKATGVVTSSIVAGENKVASMSSDAVNRGVNAVGDTIKGFGKGMSSFGKAISNAA